MEHQFEQRCNKIFSKNYLKIINSLLHSRVDKKSKKKFIMIRSYSLIKLTYITMFLIFLTYLLTLASQLIVNSDYIKLYMKW